MERVMGIEPTPSAWKAEVLPLNYTRPLPPAESRLRRFQRYPAPSTARKKRGFCPLPYQCAAPGAAQKTTSSPVFPHGGGGRIRTFEGVSRQIYSLLPLTAWVPHREKRAAYSDFGLPECQCELARLLLRRAGPGSPQSPGGSQGRVFPSQPPGD